LRNAKKVVDKWAYEKIFKDEYELQEIEDKLEGLLFLDHASFFFEEYKFKVIELEKNKRTFLDSKEST
jgi:hypothetical protein